MNEGNNTKGGGDTAGTMAAADELEVFLATGTRAMCLDALAVCAAQKDRHAWAYALLALSAERAAYEARDRMTPEEFQSLQRVVRTHVSMMRTASAQVTESRSEGARLIAAALTSRLHR